MALWKYDRKVVTILSICLLGTLGASPLVVLLVIKLLMGSQARAYMISRWPSGLTRAVKGKRIFRRAQLRWLL